MIRYTLPAAIVLALGAFFLPGRALRFAAVTVRQANNPVTPAVTESPAVSSTPTTTPPFTTTTSIAFTPISPPDEIRGIYVTGWTAGSPNTLEAVLARAEKNNINSVVVDVKDYSGFVSYKTGDSQIAKYGAEGQPRIPDINRAVMQLKKHRMYTIARITIFQDSVLAKGAPQWALKSKKSGGLWRDHKGLAWMDPSSQEVWDYNIRIAKNALEHGFDEVNFDYVRFPSDGVLSDIVYPFWDGRGEKREVMRRFFAYLRKELPDAKISADLFGLVTVREDDMGIGQVLEDALPYFDAVAPMTYPSHYVNGFLGYQNPAEYPYEVMRYSLEHALARVQKANASGTPVAKLRPWFQAFDLGATYDQAKMDAQRRAYQELRQSAPDFFDGWLLWDPKNKYYYY